MSDEKKVVVYSSTAYSPYGDSVDYVKYSDYADLKAENERLRGKLRKAIDYVNMQGHHNMSCRYKITYYQWENAEPCDCSIKEFIEEITP